MTPPRPDLQVPNDQADLAGIVVTIVLGQVEGRQARLYCDLGGVPKIQLNGWSRSETLSPDNDRVSAGLASLIWRNHKQCVGKPCLGRAICVLQGEAFAIGPPTDVCLAAFELLENDAVLEGFVGYVVSRTSSDDSFEAPSRTLFEEARTYALQKKLVRAANDWPRQPATFSGRLRKHVSDLERLGILVSFSRDAKFRKIAVTVDRSRFDDALGDSASSPVSAVNQVVCQELRSDDAPVARKSILMQLDDLKGTNHD